MLFLSLLLHLAFNFHARGLFPSRAILYLPLRAAYGVSLVFTTFNISFIGTRVSLIYRFLLPALDPILQSDPRNVILQPSIPPFDQAMIADP